MQNVYGLNIHLYAFQLNHDLLHNNEKIRVSITTLPEEKKQHFRINPKYINNINHSFSVNITKKTKKIVFVFRRKNFLRNDPIIASTIITDDEIPKSIGDTNNTELKTIFIFEPLSKIRKENREFGKCYTSKNNINSNRRIVGQMNIQFQLTDPFPEQEYHNKSKKNGHNFKKTGYEKMKNNENIEANAQYNNY